MLQCLLIDGSLTIQKVVKLTLSKYDVSVSSLNSLHEASVFISSVSSKIDFIISDSFLEGTVTPESLKKLSIQAHAPILILNGSFQGVDEASFKKEGFFFFLKKPFESSTLVSNIEALIKKSLPLKEDEPQESVDTDEEDTNTSSFAPQPPPAPHAPSIDKPINIPPSISFKEELSLQEKMKETSYNDNRLKDLPPPPSAPSFATKEPSLKTPLPPIPQAGTSSVADNISIREENITPPPPIAHTSSHATSPSFIPNIPVDKRESKRTSSNDIDSLNLPPPPFIDKNLNDNDSNEYTGSYSKSNDDVFSKKLPPIPSDEPDSSKSVPFSPSKEYLEENIGKIVNEYLDSHLEDLVKQEVKNYCDAHFKTIATECIKEKINKLLEEKVSLSENS